MKISRVNSYLTSFTGRLNYGKEFFNSDFLSVCEKFGDRALDKNEICFKYIVHKGTQNYWGAMHGGAIATLIDIATTIAITAEDRTGRKNISIELSTQYLLPAKEELYLLCKVGKIGKSVGFSSCEIYDKNLNLCCTSSHTKAMLSDVWELEKNDKI